MKKTELEIFKKVRAHVEALSKEKNSGVFCIPQFGPQQASGQGGKTN